MKKNNNIDFNNIQPDTSSTVEQTQQPYYFQSPEIQRQYDKQVLLNLIPNFVKRHPFVFPFIAWLGICLSQLFAGNFNKTKNDPTLIEIKESLEKINETLSNQSKQIAKNEEEMKKNNI